MTSAGPSIRTQAPPGEVAASMKSMDVILGWEARGRDKKLSKAITTPLIP